MIWHRMFRVEEASFPTTPPILQLYKSFLHKSSKSLWFRCRTLRKLNTKLNLFSFVLECTFWGRVIKQEITEDPPQKRSFSGRNFSSYLSNAHKELGLLFVCFKTRNNLQFHIRNLYVMFQPGAYFYS